MRKRTDSRFAGVCNEDFHAESADLERVVVLRSLERGQLGSYTCTHYEL